LDPFCYLIPKTSPGTYVKSPCITEVCSRLDKKPGQKPARTGRFLSVDCFSSWFLRNSLVVPNLFTHTAGRPNASEAPSTVSYNWMHYQSLFKDWTRNKRVLADFVSVDCWQAGITCLIVSSWRRRSAAPYSKPA
jgi:hypothetical protein